MSSVELLLIEHKDTVEIFSLPVKVVLLREVRRSRPSGYLFPHLNTEVQLSLSGSLLESITL